MFDKKRQNDGRRERHLDLTLQRGAVKADTLVELF